MRFITKLIFALVTLLLAIFSVIIGCLQFGFGILVIKQLVGFFTPYQFSADEVRYQLSDPFHLTLIKPQLISENQRYHVESLSATFDPASLTKCNLTFRSLVINGIELDTFSTLKLPPFSVSELSLANANLQTEKLTLNNANMQLVNWRYDENGFNHINGDVLITVDNLIWQQQKFSNVLIDGNYQPQGWQISHLSFSSEYGSVGLSGYGSKHHMKLTQLTLNDAKLDSVEKLVDLKKQITPWLNSQRIEIERLDVLDFTAAFPQVNLEHLTLSAEQLILDRGQWRWPNRQPSEISFNAGLIRFQDWVVTDLLGEFSFLDNEITIPNFSGRIEDNGFIAFSGNIAPQQIEANNVVINGVDLNLTQNQADYLLSFWQQFELIKFDELAVRHSNITFADPNFPLQLIGVNFKGQDVVLKQNNQSGLWQGKLQLNFAAGNINKISLSQSYVKSVATDGLWQFAPVELNFADGQLVIDGNIDLNAPDRPWRLNAHGLQVPANLYQQWAGVKLPLSGEHDVLINLTGLASSRQGFAYSFSGDITADNTAFIFASPSSSLQAGLSQLGGLNLTPLTDAKSFQLTTAPIKLEFDRGRIKLAPTNISAANEQVKLEGQWDIVTGQHEIKFLPK